MHGHLAARLDPLGSEPLGDPALDETRLIPPLTPELQARIPAKLLRVHVPGETLAEALPRAARGLLRHDRLRDRAHLRPRASASGCGRRSSRAATGSRSSPTSAQRCSNALARRSRAFERYLRRAFLGQKQFSIEGLDVMVPMLDEAIELAAGGGRARGRDRHGAPRPPERARAHGRALRTSRSCASSRASGRSTPSSRTTRAAPATSSTTSARDAARARPPSGEVDGHARGEPEPPRGGRPGRRGPRRAPSRPTAPTARRHPRPDGRAADPDPRRRVVRRPGRRRRDAQPLEPRRATRPAARCT